MTAVSHSQQVWAASTFKAKYEQIQCFKLNDFSGAFMWPTPTGALLWLAAEQKPWKYTIITQNNEAAFQTVQQRQKYEPSAGLMAAPAAAHCDRSRLKVSRFRSRDGDSCVISVFTRCWWSCVSLYGSQKQTNKQQQLWWHFPSFIIIKSDQ